MCMFFTSAYLYGVAYSPILVMKLSNIRSATGLDTFVLTCTVRIHLNIAQRLFNKLQAYIYIYIYIIIKNNHYIGLACTHVDHNQTCFTIN